MAYDAQGSCDTDRLIDIPRIVLLARRLEKLELLGQLLLKVNGRAHGFILDRCIGLSYLLAIIRPQSSATTPA
jgi:hypothetical protein